jgi:glycine/D-amino acid oxidase-like deaminating enzyme
MKPRSHWLADAESLRGAPRSTVLPASVDVAIVGGGFVGLWTAIELKLREPDLAVAIFESGRCGEGASGLNGGFVMSWWPKIGSLARICGADDALWLADETTRCIVELGPFLERHGIDAEYRQSGWLWTATSPRHLGSWDSVVDTAHRLGRDDVFVQVPPGDIATRSGSAVHLAGVCEPINGTVHPAKLALGLARVSESLGVAVHENARVQEVVRTSPAKLVFENGTVTARRVVLATNAWAASIPELARKFVCVGSAVIATPPIPDRLRAIGWTGGESITDSQTTVTYYRTTRDGRIVFGKGGGRLYFTGEPDALAFADPVGIAEATEDFRRTYPMLADVPIDSAWSGPIDRTYDSLPLLGTLPDAPHIAYGIGWSGNGVNPSRIGGRILAELSLEQKSRWTRNALVNRQARTFPPEPLRYLGGALVRRAMLRKDRAELAGRTPSATDRMLASLAPSGLEDKG